MSSFISWLRRLNYWSLRKLGRLDETEEVFARTGGRYIDIQGYASMEGVSIKEAKRVLDQGVQDGIFTRKYLYYSSRCPLPLVLNREDLNKTFRLSDFGEIGPDENTAVFLSENDAKEIYVPHTTQ